MLEWFIVQIYNLHELVLTLLHRHHHGLLHLHLSIPQQLYPCPCLQRSVDFSSEHRMSVLAADLLKMINKNIHSVTHMLQTTVYVTNCSEILL